MRFRREGPITKLNRSALLAWTLFSLIVIASVFSVVRNLAERQADGDFLSLVGDIYWDLGAIVFAFLASLILTFKPRNVIGWLIMMPAIAFILGLGGAIYLNQFPIPPDDVSLILLLALWANNASWLLLIFPILFVMLLFPDGQPLSRRWRWVAVFGTAMIVIFIVIGLLTPQLNLVEDPEWVIKNPMGLLPNDFEFPMIPWSAALILLTLFCAAAPFVRYRRSHGVEREQIKWLFYSCGFFVFAYAPGVVLAETETLLGDLWSLLFGISLLAIPIAITIAILRYRLYDIDVIIRKTLIYAVLTALLALVYLGIVIIVQGIFEAASGQESPISIVISTLAIAALFRPVRRRVQVVIDRRFYRRKYNTVKTLERFAITARDEVDLEFLTKELVAVVQETMQPRQVSLTLIEKNPKLIKE